jgi:CRISPR-associated endonuclease/helicase Cas3
LDKIRHRVEVRAGSLLSDVENIINEVETSGQTALIVCNHVATSQEVWKRMSGVFEDAALLHARFNSKDRADIEKKIQSDKRPRVLIATQAVEVSLDLDYDRGYTEPAPADALGQRLGRINRKGSRGTPAPVVVYEEPSADSNGAPLYLPYDQETTKRTITLFHRCDLLTERELNDIVNEIYRGGYQRDAEDDYQRGLTNPMIAEFDERIVAGTHKDWVEKVVEGSDGQIEVLPSDLYLEFGNLLKEKRYLEARMLLVPVQIRQIWRLIRENVLYRDRQWGEYIILRKYSSKTGLDMSKQIDNIM